MSTTKPGSDSDLEVPLFGVLAEFRTALREEIEAARRAASSSAVALVNGRRLGERGLSHQYLFLAESALSLPDGAPGDLIVGDRPPLEATVISIDGMAITLSLSEDVGEFVARARLQSSLGHLMRKLIERVEQFAERENPAGDRLLGFASPSGAPIPAGVDGLNASQSVAVASAMGRDTTFIWGPPGTGKTTTIGAIGERLWREGRSVLLVSHTNAAVDQALLMIGKALGPAAQDGSVLRVGAPQDQRLLEHPWLLADTHIKERAEDLEREEHDLRAEREAALVRTREAGGLIALADWLPRAPSNLAELQASASRSGELTEALAVRRSELAVAEDQEPAWRARADAAQPMSDAIAREATLFEAVSNAQSRAGVTQREIEAATERLTDATRLQQETEAANRVTRRLRRLPPPEEHAVVVSSLQSELAALRARGDRADHELATLPRQLNEVREDLAAFAARYGDSPDSILAETSRLAEELAERREATRDAARTLQQHLTNLDAQIAEPWALLRAQGLLANPPAGVGDRLQGVHEGHGRAVAEVGELNVDGLRAEISDLNSRVREIDGRLRAIAEETAAIEEAVIADARIVATTLTRAYLRDSIQSRQFDTVILDEASMAPIPALWVAAAMAEANVVVVGDFRQLPPIKLSEHELATKWLGRDVFEVSGVRRSVEEGHPPECFSALSTQHRMHPQISAIPNTLIYDGLLTDAPSTSDDSDLDGWFDRTWGPDAPVVLVDTEPLHAWVTGVGGAGRTSRLNFLSATVCADLAERMLRQDRPALQEGAPRRLLIGAPYRPHARLVELLVRDLGLEREVVAGTAHTFQGSEAPVVIFDLVNDQPHWRVGLFTPDFDETTRRLLNVALTRPQHRLVIVGNFAYARTRAKHAFVGELVRFLEARYPKVDARDLVSAGLAARAARAQLRAVDGPIESDEQRLVVTQDDFYVLLARDLAAARERVVIYSPFITANRMGQLEPHLKAAVERGVRVVVATKTLEERGDHDQATYSELERALRVWGIEVLHKRQMHEKLVFIDHGILWSGSLNPLSFSATQEVMERRDSERVVGDYAQALRLADLLALAASADRGCPICGTALAMAEGPSEPYWRCPNTDCDYTRNIGKPAPRDGLIICGSPECGKPLKFGYWGDDPHWRCTVNPRHRQRIAKSHLRLPKMQALVPAGELRQLNKRFGLKEPFGNAAPTRKLVSPPASSPRTDGAQPVPTPRELDILRLLAAHRSRRQIAAELGLSDQTVKTYLRDLYRKLDVHERADAVRLARRSKWL